MAKKIAIIGGGVIGLYLGWKFSQKGEKVVVFEKKKESLADFKCCSGLVSERIRSFIPIEKKLIKNKIEYCRINFLNKSIKLFFEPSHLALDREGLVRKLIELNRETGTELEFENEILDIPKGFDRVIICNGANSSLRKKMGLLDPNFKLGAQLIVDGKNDDKYVETFPIESGFCWKIPRGDKTEYGIMSDYRNLKEEFDSFLISQNKRRGDGDFYSAVIPQPGFNSLIFSDRENVFLCGDTMGLTKPWSGGGIIWGLTAADILIKNIDNLSDYEREIKKKFYYTITKGYLSNFLVRWIGKFFSFLLPERMTYDNDFPNLLKSISGLIKK
jgi:flavin-dependent dehydrogenase